MKEITVITEKGCPYCAAAEGFIRKVQGEYPKVRVRRISSDSKESEPYDFYFLPAVFVGTKRMIHGACTLADIRQAFQEATKDKMN